MATSTYTLTHNVLFKMDIPPQIIEHLGPQSFPVSPHDWYAYEAPECRRGLRACTHLATVYKSFTDPVLDILRSIQHGFHPIFALMPELQCFDNSKLPPVCHSHVLDHLIDILKFISGYIGSRD